MTGFREQGSGIPLMLLHGISSGAASWHKQMALNGFRVLAWDMPGYGESPMLAVARANAGDYADVLAAMLDRAGVWQAVLVGHSLGALVASAFAAKFPDRVIHLVLADAAQGYGNAAPEQREQVWRNREQQMALNGFRVLAWDMPGYGESPMLAVARANAGDYADALAAMLDRAGVWQAVLVGHSLGALVASAFAAKFPDRVIHLVLADAAQGYGNAAPEQREQVWRNREQQMALGGEILAQTRAAKLLRPGARAEDIATVAAGMRTLRPEGYLAAAWMLAHDDIHGWLKRYAGTFEVWCGEQDAITQPELVQGLALRYGMPFTAIPQAGHASYLDNDVFFNQQLLRINEEVRDECTN